MHEASGGVASFQFEELCARPLGSADYLALAHAFHTIFLRDIPAMSLQVGCCTCKLTAKFARVRQEGRASTVSAAMHCCLADMRSRAPCIWPASSHGLQRLPA